MIGLVRHPSVNLEEAIRDLRAHNEEVPLPLRLPSAEDVDEVERQLNRQLPSDFRRYLLEASDIVFGAIEPVTITRPASHTDLIKVVAQALHYGVPGELIPICEFNSDFYCINSANEVVYWSHNGWDVRRWPSLAHWIRDVWLDCVD